MERRIVRHSTRLTAALDPAFQPGQRVRTLDGAIGRVILVDPSFSPGNESYQVILDNGQGGGTYLGSQLRPVPEGYGGGHQAPAHLPAGVTAALEAEAELEHVASDDYPEMGGILEERPDPGRQISVIGHLMDWDTEDDDPDEHNATWCHVCGEHHDSEEEADQHDSAHTDWDEVYPHLGPEVHRGITADLPSHLHAAVHDQSVPLADRAHMLSEHFRGRPIGNSWSTDPGKADHYTVVSGHYGGGGQTHVMFHAATPAREHIETDPYALEGRNVLGYDKHEDNEVPLRDGAPLQVHGISWRLAEEGAGYTRALRGWNVHRFEHPHQHLAAAYADGFDPRARDYNGEPQVGGVYWGAPAQQKFVDDELGQPEPGPIEMMEPEPGEPVTAAMHVPDWMERGIMSDPSMTAEDHTFMTHVFDHIRRGAPASEPIDAEDAMTMARGHRTRDRMADAGWEMHPEALKTRYPRGFNLLMPPPGADSTHDLTHTLTLSPNHPKGWHVRTSIRNHPVGAAHIHHDLDVMDDELPHELHRYVNHPDIASALAEQRAQAATRRTASVRDDKSDRWHEYNQQFRPGTLHRGIHVRLPEDLHDYVHDDSQPREDRAAALAQHFADRGGLGRHWTPHTQIAHRAIWNAADAGGYEDDDNPEYSIDDYMEDHGYGEDEDEQEEPRATHTDVMFHVKRPGRRNEIRDPRQLEQHEVGWAHSRDEDETFLKPGTPLKLEGVSWKPHEPEYPNEPFEHHDFARPMRHVARVPWTPHEREQLHKWQEHPTASYGDFVPSHEFTNKYPEPEPGPDPEAEFAEAVGPKAFTEMTARLAAHPVHEPGAEAVYQQLSKNYPPGALSWVHDAQWEGPHYVPLDQVDYEGQDRWEASHDPGKVSKSRKKIEKREEKGEPPKKPAVLVARPGKPAQMVADGHHRALAAQEMEADGQGNGKGLWAWTGHVDADEGPWDSMHDHQDQEQYFPPPDDGMGDSLQDGDLSATQPVQPMVTRGLPPMSQGPKPGPRTKNMIPPEQSPAFLLAHPELQQQQEPPPGEEDGEDEEGGDTDKALDSFEKAAGSAPFRFEFTAAWKDVVAKAERIVRENGVRITALAGSLTVGEVKGDHATYETGLQYYPGRGWSVMAYSCGCPWATFWQNPDQPGRFAGRMCSHAYALGLAARQRGQVRKTMFPDLSGWPETVVVKSEPPWHPSDKSWAREWRAPLTDRPVLGSLIGDTLDDQARMPVPAVTAARVLVDAGEDPAAVTTLLRLAGLELTADQANAPWGSQDLSNVPPQKPYGATTPPQKDQDPGSYGFLAGPDPENWGEIADNSAIQAPLTNEAAKADDGPAVLDQPDTSDWAGEGQTFAYQEHDGARIIDNPAGRSGVEAGRVSRYREARQGTGPVLDSEANGVSHDPDVMHTNTGPVTREWGEGFPYADRAAAGGPVTSLTPRDPQGIRMEETLREDAVWATNQRDRMDPEFRSRGHDMDWKRGYGWNRRDQAQYWEGTCRHCGAGATVGSSWSSSHTGKDARHETCSGPGTGWQNEMVEELRHERVNKAVSEFGQAVQQNYKDADDREWLRGQGIEASLGEPQPDGALAELKDEPEGALEEDGLTAADPSQTYPAQVGAGISGQAQHPDQFTTQNPGMGALDEPSVPSDSSMQTMGQQQWSGGDYNSGDLANPGADEHDVEDDDVGGIVAAFQRSAAAGQYSGDGAARVDSDIAGAARAYLAKTADVLPAGEADELIREGRGTRARNLDLLDLKGTHYTDEPGLDDRDDDVLYA